MFSFGRRRSVSVAADPAVRRVRGVDVFMSYSRVADSALAPALQRALTRLAKPWNRPRALRVFRDRTDLSAAESLTGAIERAIADARYFLLLASPAAARSRWVGKEIEYWRRRGKDAAHFLIAVTEGTVTWDDRAGDFDWQLSDALPPALKGYFRSEPVWEDLGWARTAEQLSVRHSEFRSAVASLAAPVHGCGKEELDSEDVRQHRTLTRLRNAAVAALTVLLVVALVAGLGFLVQRNDARARQRAAVSRALVDEAAVVRGRAPQLALMLGIAADRIHSTAATRTSLLAGLTQPYAGTMGGHGGQVSTVEFGPTGILATVVNTRVLLWRDGRVVGELTGENRVDAVAFAPDGRTLATGGLQGELELWDITDPAVPRRTAAFSGGGGGIAALAFSPSAPVLISCGDEEPPTMWQISQVSAPRRITTLSGHSATVWAAAFSGDGRLLLTADESAAALLWDTSDPAAPRRLARMDGEIGGLLGYRVFSADNRRMVTIDGNAVIVWDIADPRSPRVTARLTGSSHMSGALLGGLWLSDSGDQVEAVDVDHGLLRWDLGDPARPIRRTLVPGSPTNMGYAVATSWDGRRLVSAADDTVILWDSAIESVPRPPVLVPGAASPIRIGPTGLIAAGDAAGDVVLGIRANAGSPIPARTLDRGTGRLRAIAFSPGGELLLTGNDSGDSAIWNVAEPDRPYRVATPPSSVGAVRAVEFSADGRLFVIAGEHGAELWLTADPGAKSRCVLRGRRGPVTAVAFAPDGHTLAVGSFSDPAVLWDISDPSECRRLGETTGHIGNFMDSLAFAPDGRTLATGSRDGSAVLWDIADRNRPRVLGAALVRQGDWLRPRAVAFSPDGRLLATGGADKVLTLWDVSDPAEPHLLTDTYLPGDEIRDARFSPDGRTVTIGAEAAGYLLDLTPLLDTWTSVFRLACERAGRGLDAEEWRRYAPGLAYRQTCG